MGSPSPWEGAILRGEGRPIVKYRDTAVICSKTVELIEMPFGLWTWVGPRKHILDGAQIPHAKGQLLGERTVSDSPLLWAVQNGWTNRFAVSLWTLVGPKRSTNSIIFARWHQRALMGGQVDNGKYDFTARLWWWCGLVSNYFDHLLLLGSLKLQDLTLTDGFCPLQVE